MRLQAAWIILTVSVALGAGAGEVRADRLGDLGLTMRVKVQLLEKLGAEALEIDVDATDGAVRLSGDVEKRATLELAATIAQSVSGVSSVDNDLTLENHAGKTKVERAAGEAEREVKDAILESRIRIALVDALGGAGFKIGTEAADGVVLLEVPDDVSGADRDRAVDVVRGMKGVERVATVPRK